MDDFSGMDGAALAEEARRIVPGLPVLLITGYSNTAEGPASLLPRLNKPFRQADLAVQVGRLFERAEPDFAETAA